MNSLNAKSDLWPFMLVWKHKAKTPTSMFLVPQHCLYLQSASARLHARGHLVYLYSSLSQESLNRPKRSRRSKRKKWNCEILKVQNRTLTDKVMQSRLNIPYNKCKFWNKRQGLNHNFPATKLSLPQRGDRPICLDTCLPVEHCWDRRNYVPFAS